MNRKNVQKQLYLLIFLSFLSVGFLLFGRTTAGWSFRGFFDRPLVPLQRFWVKITRRLTAPLTRLAESESLADKNDQLSLEVARLSSLLAEFSVCQEDNEAMRRLLDAPLPPSWHYLPAKAIEVSGRLKINIGSQAGVKAGQMVVTRDILVGRILMVSPYTSVVELITDPSVSIPVVTRLAGQKGVRAKGVVSGAVGQHLILREVLWEEAIGEGDFVYSSGEGGWLANLLVGKIVQVEGGQTKTFREARVSPFLSVDQLDSVFIVRDYSTEESE